MNELYSFLFYINLKVKINIAKKSYLFIIEKILFYIYTKGPVFYEVRIPILGQYKLKFCFNI